MRMWASHLTIASVLVALLTVTLLGCGSGPTSSTGTGPAAAGGPGGGPGQSGGPSPRNQLIQLGITGEPNHVEPRGLVVTGFVSSAESSPLGAIGVKVGDKIVSCNGQQEQMASRIISALDGLESRGEPIVLLVIRDGERVTLERTEKLPSGGSDESPE